ncbi:MAG: hypothetical protein HFF20_05660 [Oscillospiraceae bacterium]|jgi:flagellar basal-body rod modification protein FlgD|nr:hypothetical protein [Oscillospiraceae bacterium]MCI9548694.1 hypothetical protein [Oscillospiraceae bacterium]
MANEFAMDVSSLNRATGAGNWAQNSTSRPGNTELDMTDFLKLMIVQLQSQTLDDSMDTSEMMNQMVQMQMVTAITNMTETNIMTYASSLVGKEVTIGIVNDNELEERVITVIGTGLYNGQQVIFGSDGKTYALNQIMAVGRLPEPEEPDKKPDEGGDTPPVDGSGEGDNKPGPVDPGEGENKPTDPVEPGEGDNNPTDPGEDGNKPAEG